MEVLTRQLRKAQDQKKCGIGIKLSPRASKLPCLLFADDSLLFCRTNLETCQLLDRLLNNFCQNSGQLINYHKSSIIFSKNATTHDKRIVSSVFNICWGLSGTGYFSSKSATWLAHGLDLTTATLWEFS